MCHREREDHTIARCVNICFKTDIPVEQHRKTLPSCFPEPADYLPDGQMPERRHVRDKEISVLGAYRNLIWG